MKAILGISAFYHDSAASIVADGKIIAAAQEERFTREKHTADFPIHAIRYCLDEAGLDIGELDAIVFYDKPFLKFERLLQTYYSFSPKGIVSFLKAIPVWLKEKIFLKKMIYKGLAELGGFDRKKCKLLFPEHHLSHAASAFFPSSFEKAAVLTIDGVGEWCTASISIGEGNSLKILKELHFPHSVGLLYSAFTYYLGFTVNSGEYKLMGLAPYGNRLSQQTADFVDLIKSNMVDIKDDGSIWLNQEYFRYATGLHMTNDKRWEKLLRFPRRHPESEIEQIHCDLALAIQQVTEEIVVKMAKEAKKITGADYLCMAGGVALNCVANGKLLNQKIFKDIYIQPASGDAGGALGAALAVNYLYYGQERVINKEEDAMSGTYLGPSFSESDIQKMNKKNRANYVQYANYNELIDFVALRLSEGKVIGWFQNRMEFGPRALGNRSILGDARRADMQKKMNLKIKYREGFRPFAPSVLAEKVSEYFDLDTDSPYMLLVAPVKESRRNALPDHYDSLPLWERLYFTRSDIQAVTHLDFSARVQTVHKNTNERYWQLIDRYHSITSYALLVNTSFNVRGEPIVCNPYDAYRCFMSTDMDLLVIGDFVYEKTKQIDPTNKSKWQIRFKKD